MALNLIRGSNRSIYISMLAMLLTSGLSACQQVPQEQAAQGVKVEQAHEGIFYFPKGAVMPAGLSEITGETTQDEAIKILGSRYHHLYDTRLDNLDPVQDVFSYKEDGETKYIDVWYLNEGVDHVRFGYDAYENLL